MNYPNGKPYSKNKSLDGRNPSPFSSNIEYGGRGMSLEKDIEHSNAYYLKSGIAVIHKKPTPVQIVNVHYPKRSKAVINEAYFRTPSTTDYN
ncbi:Holliday junction resolvase RecU, partial [Staphylococcus caprae]